MFTLKRTYPVAFVLLLGACTTIPTGPSVLALPGTGKPFNQYQADESSCRQFALDQIGGKTPGAAAEDSGVRSAALGTVLGAAVGGLIGGRQGSAVGAGSGLLIGALSGADSGERSGRASQQHYDNAYVLCMYDKGHRVPVSGRMAAESRNNIPPPPPPPGYGSAGAPPIQTPPPTPGGLIVYPKNGQSAEQTALDQRACDRWANVQMRGGNFYQKDYERALGACLEGRGYTVR